MRVEQRFSCGTLAIETRLGYPKFNVKARLVRPYYNLKSHRSGASNLLAPARRLSDEPYVKSKRGQSGWHFCGRGWKSEQWWHNDYKDLSLSNARISAG